MTQCSHDEHWPGRHITESGMVYAALYCPTCDTLVSKHFGHPGVWLSDKWLASRNPPLDKHDLRLIRDERRLHRCFCCQQYRPCELHHCAPKEYFGDEAERWPVVWACTECHDRYHRRFGRPIRRPEAA